MPENLRKPILDRLQVLTVALLMPFFFALTGLRTLIDLGSPAFLEVFFHRHGGRRGWRRWRNRGGRPPFRRVVALCLGARRPAADQGPDGSDRADDPVGCRDYFRPRLSALILMAVVSTAFAMPLARLMLAREALPVKQN